MLRIYDKSADLESAKKELDKLGLPTDGLYDADLFNSDMKGTMEGLPAIRVTYRFKNGCGFSLVRNGFSYGQEVGMYELAVITAREKWTIDYDTPITGDIEGWLTEEDVKRFHEEIKNLNSLLLS